jgi:hypothetical protein
MRLLEEDEQDAVYDALYRGLMEHEKFVFRGLSRDDIFTLGEIWRDSMALWQLIF